MIFLLHVFLQMNLFCFDASVYQQNRYHLDRYLLSFHLKEVMVALTSSVGFFIFFIICSMVHIRELELLGLFVLICLMIRLHDQYEAQYPLAMTKRMIRLLGLTTSLLMLIGTVLLLLPPVWRSALKALFLGFHTLFFLLFIRLSAPMENYFRRLIRERAVKKLNESQCLKIGITGSYGKTSVKTLLHEVLNTRFAACCTPLSYNNEMGISKTILENLKDYHEIFICEMGADHVHEIEDLSAMIQPSIAIVTSIGPQHLSTFKSIQNIINEKMQLIEKLPKEGIGFINVDNVHLKNHVIDNPCQIKTVGIQNQADIQALHLRCSAEGSQFDVLMEGKLIPFATQLLGEHNILNCLFVIAVAAYLKMDTALIQAAIANCRPIEHRLQLKSFYEGVCIDNAYNSNPDSAEKALAVLKMMPGRHFLITPGFLDLGEHHDYYSYEFGRQMLEVCDEIILVGKCETIVSALLGGGFDENHLFQVNHMHEAIGLASVMMHENDCVLIENDIPESLSHH